MKNRDFREIQVSSSILVFIFLGVLVLGAIIFLLGVSVGKKQSQIVADTRTPGHTVTEILTEEKPVPAIPAEEKIQDLKPALPAEKPPEKKEPPAVETPKAAATPAKPAPTETAPKPAVQGAFAIQVGAFDDRASARQVAERFNQRGYTAVVLEPLPDDRRPFFRVRLRGYASRNAAQAALDGLNAAEKKKTGYYLVRE